MNTKWEGFSQPMRDVIEKTATYYEKNGMSKEDAKDEAMGNIAEFFHSNYAKDAYKQIQAKSKSKNETEKKFMELYFKIFEAKRKEKKAQPESAFMDVIKKMATYYEKNGMSKEDAIEKAKKEFYLFLNSAIGALMYEELQAKYKTKADEDYAEKYFKIFKDNWETQRGPKPTETSGGRRKTRRSHKRKGTRKMRRSTRK
jgi:hypothetical protein